MRILVLSGPNLNLLGTREPEIYGAVTLEQIHQRLAREAEDLHCEVECAQSNHEGVLIDLLQARRDTLAGALLNAGGLTHTSVSLHDTIKAMPFPVIEVHLSNIHAREPWRSHSLLAPAVLAQVAGLGWYSYIAALRGLVSHLRGERPEAR
ncbi:MAG: type II 3-dehydroquinate dehydratase [Chloroflexota bacterium]